MSARLELSRAQIVAHRLAVNGLRARLPAGPSSLHRAAFGGLTDSMPRAALLSIHARVDGAGPDTWADDALVQVWGPRFSAYVIAAPDRAVFTLGRLGDGERHRFGEQVADRLDQLLDGQPTSCTVAGRALGIHPNAIRYAAPTGRLLIRWDGARQPTIWTVPAPDLGLDAARLELARRYLRVFAPGTVEGFGEWAGIRPARARTTFERLSGMLVPVRSPIGEGWILASDEAAIRESGDDGGAGPAGGAVPQARLLPSGDTLFLLWGADRELLVPDPIRRAALWTPRVWPGAILLGDAIVGTWRRADAILTLQPWQPLSTLERDAVTAEAETLPIPGAEGRIVVRWVA